MATGVFFHKIFSEKTWLVIGDKFRNFPKVMKRQLKSPDVILFSPEKVEKELLLKVHSAEFINKFWGEWYAEGALYSVGGCVEAVEKILSGGLENALVFTVAAGHHAERSSAWGGTYLSCSGPALSSARDKFGHKRFAILDTDRHHGNGTRDIFIDDEDVLHVCFCNSDKIEGNDTKVCVNIASATTDQAYIEKVLKEFTFRLKDFSPDMILHILGHDTCEWDYGDIGLTMECFPELVKEIRCLAAEVCGGRYAVLTHGGKRADVAEYIFPEIIGTLAGK